IIDCANGIDEKYKQGDVCSLNLTNRFKRLKDQTCIEHQRIPTTSTKSECYYPYSLSLLCEHNPSDLGCQYIRGVVEIEETYFFFKRIISMSSPTNKLSNVENRIVPFFNCHRGIPIESKEGNRCLCPPSYYGDLCQYQSERLTIYLQIETSSDDDYHETAFKFLISLMSEEQNNTTLIVVDSEEILHFPYKHLSLFKHLFYLNYPSDKKTKQFYVRIDSFIVTTTSVQYHLSWYYSVQFSFLPVNRLALILRPNNDKR
ncbi:unnamed protein product, partial [Didymodactylos carnosus]